MSKPEPKFKIGEEVQVDSEVSSEYNIDCTMVTTRHWCEYDEDWEYSTANLPPQWHSDPNSGYFMESSLRKIEQEKLPIDPFDAAMGVL